jgi:hypothetical protein
MLNFRLCVRRHRDKRGVRMTAGTAISALSRGHVRDTAPGQFGPAPGQRQHVTPFGDELSRPKLGMHRAVANKEAGPLIT